MSTHVAPGAPAHSAPLTQARTPAEVLAARLEDPNVAGSLGILLDHADLLAILVVGLDGLVSRSEVIGDSLADGLNEVKGLAEANKPKQPIDIAAVISSLMSMASALPKLAPAVTRVADDGVVDALFDSGMTDPKTLDLMGTLVQALNTGAAEARAAHKQGVLSMARQLKDPDVQRGLGFTMSMLRALGRELDPSQSTGRTAEK